MCVVKASQSCQIKSGMVRFSGIKETIDTRFVLSNLNAKKIQHCWNMLSI